MLESIRRWFSHTPTQAGWDAAQRWAEERGRRFKRTREGDGFVVESDNPPWRLEWGVPQRAWVRGAELRLRAELGASAELQMMLLTRALMSGLEKQVFEQYTEQLQTRIDSATPEEMRWLVLHPQLPAASLGSLRDHFGGVAAMPQMIEQWLAGPLEAALAEARAAWLGADEPLLLIVQRGRLTARCSLPRLNLARVEQVLALFDVARREARRVAEQWSASDAAQSTQPSLWGRDGPPTKV